MAQTRKPGGNAARKVRLHVVTKADGTIIGGLLPDSSPQKNIRLEFRPLPGQTVHDVEIDERLVKGRTATQVQAALSAYRVVPGESRLIRAFKERPRRR